MWSPDHVDPEYREVQSASKTLGVQVRSLEVRSAEDFDAAFEAATNDRIQALMPVTSRLMSRAMENCPLGATRNCPLLG
jgi:hypothetical protein